MKEKEHRIALTKINLILSFNESFEIITRKGRELLPTTEGWLSLNTNPLQLRTKEFTFILQNT